MKHSIAQRFVSVSPCSQHLPPQRTGHYRERQKAASQNSDLEHDGRAIRTKHVTAVLMQPSIVHQVLGGPQDESWPQSCRHQRTVSANADLELDFPKHVRRCERRPYRCGPCSREPLPAAPTAQQPPRHLACTTAPHTGSRTVARTVGRWHGCLKLTVQPTMTP